MDKNVTKNIVIIVLVIFLGFSAVLNIFYIYRSQVMHEQNSGLVYFGSFPQNRTTTDFHLKPFNELPQSTNDYSAIGFVGNTDSCIFWANPVFNLTR